MSPRIRGCLKEENRSINRLKTRRKPPGEKGNRETNQSQNTLPEVSQLEAERSLKKNCKNNSDGFNGHGAVGARSLSFSLSLSLSLDNRIVNVSDNVSPYSWFF